MPDSVFIYQKESAESDYDELNYELYYARIPFYRMFYIPQSKAVQLQNVYGRRESPRYNGRRHKPLKLFF